MRKSDSFDTERQRQFVSSFTHVNDRLATISIKEKFYDIILIYAHISAKIVSEILMLWSNKVFWAHLRTPQQHYLRWHDADRLRRGALALCFSVSISAQPFEFFTTNQIFYIVTNGRKRLFIRKDSRDVLRTTPR